MSREQRLSKFRQKKFTKEIFLAAKKNAKVIYLVNQNLFEKIHSYDTG